MRLQVKQHLEEQGTDEQKEAAKEWSVTTLYYKFGLASKEVRRRIEGLSGAVNCYKYKFLDEGPESAADAGAREVAPKKSKPKSPKLSTSSASAPEAEAEEQDNTAFNKKSKKAPPPQITAYRLYSKEMIADVKKANSEASTGDIVKMIKSMYAQLDEDKRQHYESEAQIARDKQAARRAHADHDGDASEPQGLDKDAPDADKKEEQEEEEKTVWCTEGSDYIGKKVRRYVFDGRDRLIDAADGVVVGWLSKEESDYNAEATGEPAPLWHMTYDDARIGSEDLEEHEVVEAMELMDQELPDKVRVKYEKRLEVIVQQQARAKDKKLKAAAKEEAKMIKALQQVDREAQKLDRDRLRAEREKEKALSAHNPTQSNSNSNITQQESKVLPPVLLDEALVLVQSGKFKGIRSSSSAPPLSFAFSGWLSVSHS